MPTVLQYPVTDAIWRSLPEYPRLADRLRLRQGERRPQYILALLDNPHYEHNRVALRFIEDALPWAGRTGRALLEAPLWHHFARALDELALLGHLRGLFSEAAHAPADGAPGRIPDVLVDRPGQLAAVEVYTPADCTPKLVLNALELAVFRYADVQRGFHVRMDVTANRDGGLSTLWPLDLPRGEASMLEWMASVAANVRDWLSAERPAKEMTSSDPSGVLTLRAELVELRENPQDRLIGAVGPTQSTDSRIMFEREPAVVAATPWGVNLREKMCARQAGADPGERLRVLVVNFRLMDTGEPEFIGWQDYADWVRDALAHIAAGIESAPPYDLVVPAVLLFTPIWGKAAILPHVDAARGEGFLRSAGMEFTPQPRPW